MRAPLRQANKNRVKRAWDRRPVTLAAMLALVGIELVLFLLGVALRTNQVTIAIYEGIEGEPLKRVAERFSEKTGTRVQILSFSYDDLYEAEARSLAAPRGDRAARFDVIMLDDPWLEGLLAGKNPPGGNPLLLPLDISQTEAADFFASCLRAGQHPYCSNTQSKCSSPYYAVPFAGNATLFCYRGEAGSHPPSTWAEIAALRANARGIGHAGDRATDAGYAMRLGAGNSIVTDFIPMLWASAPGGPQADGSFGPSALGPLNPKTKDAFVELAQLSADRSYGTRSQDDFDLAVYMLDGKATSSIMWSAYAMALANLGSAEAAMQNLQFGKVPGTPVVGAWLLAVPANREASQQKLAKGFAAFATSGEQLNLAAAEGNPPPRRSVMAARSFGAQYPRSFEAQRQSLEEAMPRPRRPDWKQVELRIGNCLADLSSGLIGPDDAFAGFNNAIRNTPGVQPLSDKGSGCVSAAAKAEVPRR